MEERELEQLKIISFDELSAYMWIADVFVKLRIQIIITYS